MAIAAIGQICSTRSILANLEVCAHLVRRAAQAGAKTVFLPEASDYISSTTLESSELARSHEARGFIKGLQDAASRNDIEISVGVHEPTETGERVKNVQLWVDAEGNIVQKYQKVHLFDVNVKNGPIIEESKGTERGSSLLPPFQTRLGLMGMLICFDIRFPEASLALRRQGAQIITYPSAFAVMTGQAHWKPLLQARAIETQSFIVAAAQSGHHNENRTSYGHSMVVDPWGKIIAELGEESDPQLAFVELDLQRVEEVRREMPLVRRYDVYNDFV